MISVGVFRADWTAISRRSLTESALTVCEFHVALVTLRPVPWSVAKLPTLLASLVRLVQTELLVLKSLDWRFTMRLPSQRTARYSWAVALTETLSIIEEDKAPLRRLVIGIPTSTFVAIAIDWGAPISIQLWPSGEMDAVNVLPLRANCTQ